jgi:hypothetical protein
MGALGAWTPTSSDTSATSPATTCVPVPARVDMAVTM